MARSGVAFDRIAVLLRHPARHVPLLEEAFHRAGIPVWLEGGLQRHDNTGRAFLTLLRLRFGSPSEVLENFWKFSCGLYV